MNDSHVQWGEASNDWDLLVMRLVVQKVLTPIVVLVGVIGNSLSIVVLTRRCMKSSTNSYLTALAVFDILYLLFSFSLSLRHYPESVMTSSIYVHWFPFGRVLADMSANVSVTLTVTFTIERYIGVCHPMRGRTLCTPQRARMITVLMSLVAILCTGPEFWELEVVTLTNDVTNATEYGFRYTPFAQDPSYDVGYYWFLVLGFTFLPLVLLCVFNGILILTLFRAAKLRKQMSQQPVPPPPPPPHKTKFPRNRFILRGPPMKLNGYRYYKNTRGIGTSSGTGEGVGAGARNENGAPLSISTSSSPPIPPPSTIDNTGAIRSRCADDTMAFTNAQQTNNGGGGGGSGGSGGGGGGGAWPQNHAAYGKKIRSSHGKEQQKITKMLITVVLVFIVCQLPGALLLSYQTYLSLRHVTLSRYWSNVKKMAANVTNILVSVNASTNFVLYSAISLRFRRVFYRVFCVSSSRTCCRQGRPQPCNSIVETRTDAIQMLSYCDGRPMRHVHYQRQPLMYKCSASSRSQSPFSKESRHWPSDSSATLSDNNVSCIQHGDGVAKRHSDDNSSYQTFYKNGRQACFYS